MDISFRIFISIAVLLGINSVLSAGTKTFTHPNPNISVEFEAPSDWIEVPWDNDKNAYEIASPDGVVHVLLWYTDTQGDSHRYLLKMCDMNDMKFEGELSEKNINEREYSVGYTTGMKNNAKVKELIAMTVADHSDIPQHDRLYIIRIWCPLDNFESLKSVMENILNSVKIADPEVR